MEKLVVPSDNIVGYEKKASVLFPESSTASIVPWLLTESMNGCEAIGTTALPTTLPFDELSTSIVPLFFIGTTIVLPSGDHLISQGKAVAPLGWSKACTHTVLRVARFKTSTTPEGPSATAANCSFAEIATPMNPVAFPTESL